MYWSQVKLKSSSSTFFQGTSFKAYTIALHSVLECSDSQANWLPLGDFSTKLFFSRLIIPRPSVFKPKRERTFDCFALICYYLFKIDKLNIGSLIYTYLWYVYFRSFCSYFSIHFLSFWLVCMIKLLDFVHYLRIPLRLLTRIKR